MPEWLFLLGQSHGPQFSNIASTNIFCSLAQQLEVMQVQDAAERAQDVQVLGYRGSSLLSNWDSSFTEARRLQGHALASSFFETLVVDLVFACIADVKTMGE